MTIKRQEFARRRTELMALMEPDGIAIIPAAQHLIRNRDSEYAFRQDSDFYYLTGFDEPDAVLVLLPGREHGEYVLFCQERDPTKELWTGYLAGPEGAIENFDADDAFPISDIDEILPGLIEGSERVHYAMGRMPEFDRQVMEWVNIIRSKVRNGAHPPGEFVDLDHLLHELRVIKSKGELDIMRKAGEISARAHVRAMKYCQPDMFEYQLEAEIMHEFMAAGSRSAAYTTIVGAGKNGCILHYTQNNSRITSGDLVLIDAGCELDFYAADITRTFPANGKYTTEQKALYQVVLDSQIAAIAAIKAGVGWNVSHDVTVAVITQGLVDLGLLSGDVTELIATQAYKDFYMHRAGHWLGMDVHDVGDYKVGGCWRELEVGMVLTIEPGIYVAPDNNNVDEKWRGIGIRIEDDVAVTKTGCEVLTAGVPKTIAEIEALMAG